MSTVITIPLEKNKDIAALVADKQPGDYLYGCFTIKANDPQTLTVRIEEMTDKKDDLPDHDNEGDDENDTEDQAEGSVEEKYDNGSSRSEAATAMDMASPMGSGAEMM